MAKLRNGFVSNSSSSSFVISLDKITAKQLNKIFDHIELGQEMGLDCAESHEAWTISVDDNNVTGYTFMDNFDMEEFLLKIGVDAEDIEWGD